MDFGILGLSMRRNSEKNCFSMTDMRKIEHKIRREKDSFD
jgi:hypothetical protein